MKSRTTACVVAGALLAGGTAFAQTPPTQPAAPSEAPAAAPAAEPTPEHTFATKLALYSEYEYRGISQTSERAAGQLNFDYSHSSGFYLGTFVSNIKWLKDTAEVSGFDTSAKIEWDLYGGYKWEFIKDWTLDLGYLRYEYPASSAFHPKPNTDEVYAGVSYGPATLKYSYSFNDTFGVANSKGSDYLELSVNQPVMEKVTFNGILGHQRYANNSALSYSVWKAGATVDLGSGWNVGAYAKGTDAHHDLYTIKGRDWSKTRAVAFVTYTF